ncbi:MAG TPA: AI-2E family transporter [Roseiarcus sp.]|nr:AI-2E family transporter [Roseiarcus sp.]
MVIWACALVGLGVALYVLGSTVTPFALGIALGYLLDPVVQKLERLGLNRLGASLLILGAFIIVVAAALILVAPILGHQLISFIHSLPSYISRLQQLAVDQGNVLLDKYGGSWRAKFGLSQPLSTEQIENSLTDFVAERARWLLSASESLLYGGKALLSFFSILVITPVVAFYILVDWDKMVRALDIGLPRDHHDALRQMAHEINLALAGFLRGQSLVGLFLGIWYAAGLTLIGLDFGFLIGVGGGLLSFIPYVGSLTVLVISLGVAIVQGWPNWSLFLSTLGIVLVGQFLEGNVLSPKLVGDSVGLHPVWVMFALVAFGELFGLTGLLIAVPTAAAIGVLVRHLAALYLAGSLYRGHDAADGEAS